MGLLTPARTITRWWIAYPVLWVIVAVAYRRWQDNRTMGPPDFAWITLITVGLLYIDAEAT